MKYIHDVITHAKFGDDRLRGLGVVAGQISAFPIDFAGRPYNTLTLPCERVIYLHVCRYMYVYVRVMSINKNPALPAKIPSTSLNAISEP